MPKIFKHKLIVVIIKKIPLNLLGRDKNRFPNFLYKDMEMKFIIIK